MPSLGALNDVIQAAVQIKTALVKARPGRQEWEQAPPFLRCTAAPPDCVLRARKEGFSIQYSTALQLKEQGNDLVNKDPEAALERYTQALSVFLWFDRGPDRASEDVPLVCLADKLQGAEQEQAHHLLAVSFCNAAACLLQLGMTADAAYACSKALKYDPYNVKALYRRALAHRRTATTAGLEAAVEDLAAANRLEPANQQVRLALAATQHELREHRRKERGMYGNMFGSGEFYGESSSGGSGGGDGGSAAGTRAATNPAAARGTGGGSGPAASQALRSHGTAGRPGAPGGSHADEGGAGASGSGCDPEDLLFKDFDGRKARSALASREADAALRQMQRSLARARNRRLAQRLESERAARAGRFPWWAVPWWAYALIGLHLAYRLIKVWRLPLPGGRAAVPLSQQEGPHAHTEL